MSDARDPAVLRRDILKLLGVGGVAFASGVALGGCAEGAPAAGATSPTAGVGGAPPRAAEDFFFLQLSDTHWGFKGAPNPEADVTLERAIAAINAVETQPDFVVFTGDLTHTTDDARERRARLAQFKELVGGLKVKTQYYVPGEHDAAPDRGEAFLEAFGRAHYSFDHKGIHFVALDDVSDPAGVGEAQLDWLTKDLAALAPAAPVVVFTHRPLFDLYPEWEWTTRDGARVLEVLAGRPDVTVFYGHIHQEHHHRTGAITHHAARSLVFPLPAPGSVPKRAPLPWDPASPDHGLGYRSVAAARGKLETKEIPYRRA